MRKDLPIESVLADLDNALGTNTAAVLQAPPGAGKTTRVPLYLLNAPWLHGRKILMLAPRRLAARAAARRMAYLLQEKVGQTIGYRIRMDSCVSAATRIEVVTEGVLTRMLQRDPALEGTGLVIFDEFHERSLNADLGLAFCLDIQDVLNNGLRLLVMSATIDAAPVAELLRGGPVIQCEGRSFPVETRYVGEHTPVFCRDAVGAAVLNAVRQAAGSILVFLPGAGEIRQVLQFLETAELGAGWVMAPLFGNLSRDAQDRAILPAPPGKHKIVLATSIAETSLTIDGIQVVVDSGLQRVPRFDQRCGMTQLVTLPVSRAAAAQRRGRAGRLGPGICLRLWSRQMHHTLPAVRRPEILEADLTGLALELAIWGAKDPASMRWLDPPAPGAFQNASELLQNLGALDTDGRVTDHGRDMAAMPVHPRLAHMMLCAKARGLGRAACDLAALLSERDPIRFAPGRVDADMRIRFDLVQAMRRGQTAAYPDAVIDFSLLGRIVRTADHLIRQLKCERAVSDSVSIGPLLAWSYPDRIAQRRRSQAGKFLLVNGRGAWLESNTPLATESYLIAAELDGQQRNARIYRAARCDEDMLSKQFAEQIQWTESVEWDARRQLVMAQRQLQLGALTLRSEPLASTDPQKVLSALLEGIRQAGLQCLPWSKSIRRWQTRVCFLGRWVDGGRDWPDVSDSGLMLNLERWLGPYLTGITRLRELGRIDLKAILMDLLPYPQRRLLEDQAPSHLIVPSGSRIPIDYSGDMPVLAVRLQEMFGLRETPAVVGGRQPLLLHLMSPAGRPVQITSDLAGFWQTGYPQVKKELRGRYPKHHWPDDPLKARPTARAKPKR